MKYSLCILFLFFCNKNIYSQRHYTIRYEYGILWTADSKKPLLKNSVLVIRDSLSYYYTLQNGKDNVTSLPLGSKFRMHTTFTNMKKRVVLFQSQPFDQPKYLVEDTIIHVSWKMEDEKKIVAGYQCKKATALINDKETTVFYSPDLPEGFGPLYPGSLPGTILEIWWKDNPNIMTAVVVENTAKPIVEPFKGKRISRKKFDKVLKELNTGGNERIIIRGR